MREISNHPWKICTTLNRAFSTPKSIWAGNRSCEHKSSEKLQICCKMLRFWTILKIWPQSHLKLFCNDHCSSYFGGVSFSTCSLFWNVHFLTQNVKIYDPGVGGGSAPSDSPICMDHQLYSSPNSYFLQSWMEFERSCVQYPAPCLHPSSDV